VDGSGNPTSIITWGALTNGTSVDMIIAVNEDISILKNFTVREPFRVRFGAEFFNIFNRHSWTGLNTDIENVTGFGRHTGASRARSIQFLLKLDF
jgi:homospermidine synthase